MRRALPPRARVRVLCAAVAAAPAPLAARRARALDATVAQRTEEPPDDGADGTPVGVLEQVGRGEDLGARARSFARHRAD